MKDHQARKIAVLACSAMPEGTAAGTRATTVVALSFLYGAMTSYSHW